MITGNTSNYIIKGLYANMAANIYMIGVTSLPNKKIFLFLFLFCD